VITEIRKMSYLYLKKKRKSEEQDGIEEDLESGTKKLFLMVKE
jgi:hypothetical protein